MFDWVLNETLLWSLYFWLNAKSLSPFIPLEQKPKSGNFHIGFFFLPTFCSSFTFFLQWVTKYFTIKPQIKYWKLSFFVKYQIFHKWRTLYKQARKVLISGGLHVSTNLTTQATYYVLLSWGFKLKKIPPSIKNFKNYQPPFPTGYFSPLTPQVGSQEKQTREE